MSEHFWSLVGEPEGPAGCRRWNGGSSLNNPNTGLGYGVYRRKPYNDHAHRIAWQLTHGRKPEEGMSIIHLCENEEGAIGGTCVNPDHLYEGTQSENAAYHRGTVPIDKETDRLIRLDIESGRHFQDIADMFGVSLHQVRSRSQEQYSRSDNPRKRPISPSKM